MAKGKHQELLKQLLATVDISTLSESLQHSAHEAIADIGGCAFCGKAATRLCDFSIGHEIDLGHTKWPVIKSDGEHFTCDAPLCEKCCTVVGMTTITGVPTNIDWCPFHANLSHDYVRRCKPMTAHEAERLRIAAWKRTLFKVQG